MCEVEEMGDGAGMGFCGRGMVVGVGWARGGLGCDCGGACAVVAVAGLVVGGVALLLLSRLAALVGNVLLSVPFARTDSRILLVAAVTGVGCSGAFFFAIVFLSFSGATNLSLGAIDFVVAFFTADVFFASATIVSPASSAAAFLGRPRFLTAGGSMMVFVDDIVAMFLVLRNWCINSVSRQRTLKGVYKSHQRLCDTRSRVRARLRGVEREILGQCFWAEITEQGYARIDRSTV